MACKDAVAAPVCACNGPAENIRANASSHRRMANIVQVLDVVLLFMAHPHALRG
jgi:hypothetical protein